MINNRIYVEYIAYSLVIIYNIGYSELKKQNKKNTTLLMTLTDELIHLLIT